MRVRALLGCAVSVCSLLLGCASLPVPVRHVVLDSAVVGFLDKYAAGLEAEDVLCLYGLQRADSVYVMLLRPTFTAEATRTFVRFSPCPSTNPKYTGTLKLLGTWHPHLDGNCSFSNPDNTSFYSDTRLAVDLLSCSLGVVYRVK